MDLTQNRRAKLRLWFAKKTLPEKEKSYLSQLMSGKASFGEKAARRIERDYGMDAGYLDSETTIQFTDAKITIGVPIPLMNAAGSMGAGNDLPDNEVVIDSLRISKAWVESNLSQISSVSNLAFIHAIGDSMTPTFNDGDILLVDTGNNSVTADKIYVLSAHGRLFIKRVRQRIDGTYEVSSDNPAVRTTDILNGDHEIEVKGRVVWVWNGKRI